MSLKMNEGQFAPCEADFIETELACHLAIYVVGLSKGEAEAYYSQHKAAGRDPRKKSWVEQTALQAWKGQEAALEEFLELNFEDSSVRTKISAIRCSLMRMLDIIATGGERTSHPVEDDNVLTPLDLYRVEARTLTTVD